MHELTPVRADLESVFLQLTRDASVGRPAEPAAPVTTEAGVA